VIVTFQETASDGYSGKKNNFKRGNVAPGEASPGPPTVGSARGNWQMVGLHEQRGNGIINREKQIGNQLGTPTRTHRTGRGSVLKGVVWFGEPGTGGKKFLFQGS